MPRIFFGILATGAIILGALVLYVIRSSPVHETPPPSLAALQADPAPKILPSVAFTGVDGRAQSLEAFRGRVVILNVWATWCAPCVRELPALGHLAQALGQDNLVVVAVNAGRDSTTETAAFLKSHSAGNLIAYRNPDLSLLQVFGAQGLPFSVLIDTKGREIARASGPLTWDDPAAVAYFRSLAAHAAS